MYIKTLSLIAAVALCAACSSPDDPIDDTDTGQIESDAATDAGDDVSPDPGDDASQPEPDAGADGGDDDLAAAVDRYASAICDHRLNCLSPFILEVFYDNDLATCVDWIAGYASWYDADGSTTTVADFDACAAALATASCDVYLPDECRFTGSLAVGEACTAPELCDSGLCQFAEVGATCGVCARPDAEGDPCRELTFEGTGSQFYCLGDVVCGTDDTCYAPAGIGESCGPRPCQNDAECLGGQCVAQGVAGEACDRTDATLPQCFIGGGFICDESASECVPVELQAVGDTCGTSFEDLFCSDAARCIPDANTSESTCKARSPEGATCDVVRQDCQAGLICNDGVCKPRSCDQ